MWILTLFDLRSTLGWPGTFWLKEALRVLLCPNGLHHIILDVLAAQWRENNIFGFLGVRHANWGQTKYDINKSNQSKVKTLSFLFLDVTINASLTSLHLYGNQNHLTLYAFLKQSSRIGYIQQFSKVHYSLGCCWTPTYVSHTIHIVFLTRLIPHHFWIQTYSNRIYTTWILVQIYNH